MEDDAKNADIFGEVVEDDCLDVGVDEEELPGEALRVGVANKLVMTLCPLLEDDVTLDFVPVENGLETWVTTLEEES